MPRAHPYTHTVERHPIRPGKIVVVQYVAGSPLLVKAIEDGRVLVAYGTKLEASTTAWKIQQVISYGKVVAS